MSQQQEQTCCRIEEVSEDEVEIFTKSKSMESTKQSQQQEEEEDHLQHISSLLTLHFESTKPPAAESVKSDDGGQLIYSLYFPLAIFGRILGLFPSRGIDKKKEKKKSESMSGWIWTVVIRCLSCVVLPVCAAGWQVFAAIKMVHFHLEEDMPESIDEFVIILGNICMMLEGLFCSGNLMAKTTRFQRTLETFGDLVSLFERHARSLRRFVYVTFIAGLVGFGVHGASWIILVEKFELDDEQAETVWMKIVNVGMILMVASQLLTELTYVVFVRILAKCFLTLKDETIACLMSTEDRQDLNNDEAISKKIRSMRLSYQKLLLLAGDVDGLLSPAIFVSVVANGVHSSFMFYHLLTLSVTVEYLLAVILLLFLAVFPLLRIATICIVADETILQAAETVITVYSATVPLEERNAVTTELFFYSQLVSGHHLYFTASGFVHINRSLLTTVIGIMVTYVLVMLQFKEN